jgi:phosphoserine phosphatase RsbU/P
VPLAPGDAVFLCSDGLTDAVRPDGERIGRERLNAGVRRVLRAHPSPSVALHAVRRRLLHPGVQLNDDVTMVLVKRPEAGNTTSRRELPIALGSLRAVRDFVRTQALDAGLPEEEAGLFEVAGVEVFTNIVRHAKGLLPGAPVELMALCESEELVLEFFYLGEVYTPPAEVVETDFSAFPEGGFGLTIIRNASDALVYDHHDGVNSVRMTRRLVR